MALQAEVAILQLLRQAANVADKRVTIRNADGRAMFYYIEANEFCERISRGFASEPVNITSSLAYFFAAALVYLIWRRRGGQDSATSALICTIILVGYASILLHYAPSRSTVVFKIMSGALFAGTAYAMLLHRVFSCGAWAVLGHLAALGAASLFAAVVVPPRLFGHDSVFIGPLIALYVLGCIAVLQSRITLTENDLLREQMTAAQRRKTFATLRLGYELIFAGLFLAAAFVARAYDHQVCAVFSHGLYFLWHVLVAICVTLVSLAIVRFSTLSEAQTTAGADQAKPMGV